MILVVSTATGAASADGNAGVYKSVLLTPNIEVRLLNIHTGPAGPAGPSVGITPHTNVVISKHDGIRWVDRTNYHVSTRFTGLQHCWNIYESTTKREYGNCHLTSNAAQSAMQAMLIELIGIYLGHNYQNLIVIVGVIVIYGNIFSGYRLGLA